MGVASTNEIESFQRTVSTTASVLTVSQNQIQCWRLVNRGSNSAFIGSSSVTSTTGYELKTTDVPLEIEVTAGLVLYAITASSTTRVDVLHA